jgi:membrane associated rhomboid family serine protease
LALETYHPQIHLLGASGLVYLLGGTWYSLFILLDRRVPFGKRVFKATAVSLVLFFPQTLLAQVSYRSHFFGFVMGGLLGIFYFLLNKRHFRTFEEYPEAEIPPDPF